MLLAAILLICLKTCFCLKELNPKGPIHIEKASKCFSTAFEGSFRENELVTIFISKDIDSPGYEIQNNILKYLNERVTRSLEVTSGKRNHFNSFKECDEFNKCKYVFQSLMISIYYVLVVGDPKQLDDYLVKLSRMRTYKISGRYLVYYYKLVDDYKGAALALLKVLYNNGNYDCTVMVPTSLDSFNVYGYDLFSEAAENCCSTPEVRLLNKCNAGVFTGTTFITRKRGTISNLRNCQMQAVCMVLPPFVISNTTGIEINMLNEIAARLNITFACEMHKETQNWGERVNGSWQGLLEIIDADPFNVGVGCMSSDEERMEGFDFTTDYLIETMVWVVPKAKEVPQWKCIIVLFSPKLWMALVATIIIVGVLIYIAGNSRAEELNCLKSVPASFSISVQLMISVAVARQPKTRVLRTLFISLAGFSIIVSCLYQSTLIDVLTVPRYQDQIDTENEILASGVGIGGISSYKYIFNVSHNDSHSRVIQEIYKNYEIYNPINDTMYEWVLTVSQDRDTITVLGKNYIKYLIGAKDKAVVHPNGEPRIFIGSEALFTYPVRLVFSKGFPLTDTFNVIIETLIEGGLMEKWTNDYLDYRRQREPKLDDLDDEDDGIDDSTIVITVGHMIGAFWLLIVGYVTGGISLMVELLMVKIAESKEYKELRKRWNADKKKPGFKMNFKSVGQHVVRNEKKVLMKFTPPAPLTLRKRPIPYLN